MVRFNVQFTESQSAFKVDFGSTYVLPLNESDIPMYEGEYNVIPSTKADKTLKTAQKVMKTDLVVIKVPYAEVSNTAGGKTATIGDEL